MKLSTARLCLDCDEVYDEAQCPVCASESYAFIKRWVTAPEKRSRPAVLNHSRAETVATYRALLAADSQPKRTTARLLGGGLVGLAVLGAAGWMLQRSMRDKESEETTSGSAEA
jgi:hypothetical protein